MPLEAHRLPDRLILTNQQKRDDMEKFRRYFGAFSAATDWNEVQPAFNDVFHPDLCVVTPEGELSKGQWEETVKGLLVKGVRATGFEVAKEEGDAVF